MSEYRFPYKDSEFMLNEVIDFDQLCSEAGLEEVNTELAMAVLEEAGRLGSEVLAPLNAIGDKLGCTLGENGVQQAEGFAEAYRQFVDNGWASLTADEQYGGQGMPKILSAAVVEIWDSSSVSFSLCPLLTTGAVEALTVHGSDELKDTYLPHMISGEWSGSMCLTEPQAGSDLAAITTKAVPKDDHYLISGQKIFITWGDHQMTDNIIHLVLARLQEAPDGVRGISMFLVPKFLLDENGKPGERNDAYCVGIEHKMGIHASPTCTMSFGDNGGAIGYLIGKPNNGLKAMFTMMNEARQGVGIQGLGLSTRSYQQALAFAKERLQGTRKDGTRIPIIEFPDVRRMLMTMKSATEAMRGLAYIAAASSDRKHMAKTPEDKAYHSARTALYTPIVKGWMTELAQELTYLGMQIHGGMGFVEETGSAQYYRDARITTIYEGTTGIQGQDLAGRKVLADDGAALQALLDDVQATADELVANSKLETLGSSLSAAVQSASDVRDWYLEYAKTDKLAAGSSGVNLMMAMGYVCGAWVMGQSALKASKLLAAGKGDKGFLETKVKTARFYFDHLLPRSEYGFVAVKAGSESMMALSQEEF